MGHARKVGSRRGQGDEGVVLVEFALTLPLLIMILLGIFSGGLVCNSKLSMSHATREGARYASTVAASQTFASGTWASNVRDLVVERSDGDLDSAEVCVALVSGSGGTLSVKSPASTYSTSGSPCISGQTYPTTSGDPGLRVQVSATRTGTIELGVFGKLTVNLHEQATAKSESTA
jgi:Flp pilus assembly protein TadG